MGVAAQHSMSAVDSSNKDSAKDPVNRIEEELANERLSKNSLAELIDIVHKNPQNIHAHIVLGNCCDSLGLPEQAMEQYKLAFKYGPNRVESFLELIKALVRSGQLTAASSLLKQAMTKFPADPQILFWTGNALYKEHRYDEAAGLYEEALATTPKPIVGLSSALATLYLMKDQHSKALQLAMLDLGYDKNLPEANEIAGLVFMRVGKFEKACSHLAIAFKSEPNNFPISVGYCRSLMWCGNYNDALLPGLFALTTATNLNDKTFVQKSLVVISSHVSKKTVKNIVSDLAYYPELEKNAAVHTELAKICLEKHLLESALAQSLIASKLNPKSAEAKYNLALIIENYKHYYPAALQYLREAQTLEPYNREISQHLLRLEDRLNINKNDWAWQFKDWLNKTFSLRTTN